MTKSDPPLTFEERQRAEELLRLAPFAYIGVVESGAPYVVPMNFAYQPGRSDAGRLYLHTGAGRKTSALAKNPKVCVAITADAAFLQGASPCEDGFTFRSVVAEGTAALLEDREEREAALRAIVSKYDPEAASMAFDEAVLVQTLIYAVTIETVSYRELPRRSS